MSVYTDNLAEAINDLASQKLLPQEEVIEVLLGSITAAYEKKYPEQRFVITIDKRSSKIGVFVEKTVVARVSNPDQEILLKKALITYPRATLGDVIRVPFEGEVGRIEINAARHIFAIKIRELEQTAIYKRYINRVNEIFHATIHKIERNGYVLKLPDTDAFLPLSHRIAEESLRVGTPIKFLLKEVVLHPHNGYQLIADRTSEMFVKQLMALEVPEIQEGKVEIVKIARIPGYKTKIIVKSNSPDIQALGTCVGVTGSRIKPILKELGGEKIDLITDSSNKEELIKKSLKPADIDNVVLIDENKAVVFLAEDQRSFAIGKVGQNIALASTLTGVAIQLQEEKSAGTRVSLGDEEISPFSSHEEES